MRKVLISRIPQAARGAIAVVLIAIGVPPLWGSLEFLLDPTWTLHFRVLYAFWIFGPTWAAAAVWSWRAVRVAPPRARMWLALLAALFTISAFVTIGFYIALVVSNFQMGDLPELDQIFYFQSVFSVVGLWLLVSALSRSPPSPHLGAPTT